MSRVKFVRPDEKSQLVATGITVDPSTGLHKWKDEGKSSGRGQTFPPIKYFRPQGFQRIPKPKRGDWLDEHKEPGQSIARFSTGPRCHPIPRKNVIYIQPLEFNEDQPIDADLLKTLSEYASLFFDLPVKLLKPVRDVEGKRELKAVTRRMGDYTEEPQACASEILEVLKGLKPKDAFSICAITLCDIYPSEEYNFVFGHASLMDETGVYSLARYLPETTERPLLLRAIRVMCHEMCHMFGIKHCIYFSCLMNGSNHADEAVNRPTFLCPVCLRKLHFVCKFDIQARYEKLLMFWENLEFGGEARPVIYQTDIEFLQGRLAL